MEQKRRPLKKKRKSPLIQFLPYIIIVVIAAALIVAVIVITDRKDEANEVKQTQVPQETNSSQDMAEGSMQVLNVEENQGDMDANGETNNSGELDTNSKNYEFDSVVFPGRGRRRCGNIKSDYGYTKPSDKRASGYVE